MKHTINFILCLALLCFGSATMAQNSFQEGKDTTFVKDKYKIVFRPIQDDDEIQRIDSLIQAQLPAKEIPFIEGHDSIMKMLGTTGIKMDSVKYRWADSYYLESITCRNGIKVIFSDGMRFQKYYPDEDVLLTEYCGWVIDLATGEKGYDPMLIHYSQNKNLRIAATQSFDRREGIELQVYEPKQKKYITLFDLFPILVNTDYYDMYNKINAISSYGSKFYIYAYGRQWEITVKTK